MSFGRSRADRRVLSVRTFREHRRRRALPFALESLEERRLLSDVKWTGAAGDDQWTTKGNWSSDQVPGPTDDVTIGTGFSTIIYSAKSGNAPESLTIDSLNAASPIEMEAGSLMISSSTPIGSVISGELSFDGGTLAVSGNDSTLSRSPGR